MTLHYSPQLDTEQELQRLYQEYRELPSQDKKLTKAQSDKLGEMYLLAQSMAQPIVNNFKRRSHHMHDVHSTDFDDASLNILFKIANKPDIENFAAYYRSAMANAMLDSQRHITMERKVISNFTDRASFFGSDNTRQTVEEIVESMKSDKKGSDHQDLTETAPNQNLIATLNKFSNRDLQIFISRTENNTPYSQLAALHHLQLGTVKHMLFTIREAIHNMPGLKSGLTDAPGDILGLIKKIIDERIEHPQQAEAFKKLNRFNGINLKYFLAELQGKSSEDIAEIYDTTPDTVREVLRKIHVTLNDIPGMEVPREELSDTARAALAPIAEKLAQVAEEKYGAERII